MHEDYRPSPLTTWTQRVISHLEVEPDQLALVEARTDGLQSWTRAQFRTMISGGIELLDAERLPAGQVVPGLLTNRPASVSLLVAGALTGRPLAPLSPRMTRPELLASLQHLPGEVLLAEDSSTELARSLAAQLGKRVVTVGSELRGDAPLVAGHDPHAVALVMHTSGTTGLPKRVEVREFALGRRADVNSYLLRLNPGDRLVTTSLFHHVGGLGNVAVALGSGAALVIFPSFTVDAWRELEVTRPTHAVTIPSVFEMLLDADALNSSSLRVLGYGASSIHPDTMRRIQEALPDADFVNLFGQTEGSPVTALLPQDHRDAAAGRAELLTSVGRPAPGVELRIHNADTDGVGEVWARAPHSFVVDDEGWQHTGDLGRIDDGYLYLVGRRGDKIIRGGENVYPLEVEQVLLRHPQVTEAVVVGVPDRRLGETIKAFIVPASVGNPPDPQELRHFAREQLAGFKVPVDWEFLAEMPKTVTGKILRRALQARSL